MTRTRKVTKKTSEMPVENPARPRDHDASPEAARRPAGDSRAHVLKRWASVAERFGISGPARTAGALLVALEIDGDVRRRVLGERASDAAPRRAEVAEAVAGEEGTDAAMRALVELEARNLLRVIQQGVGPWMSAEIEIDPRVRAYCIGAAHGLESAPATVPEIQVPRLRAAFDAIVGRCAAEPRRYIVVIRGRPGSGRDAAFRALLHALGGSALRKTVLELRQAADPLEPELSGAAATWDARGADPGSDDYDIARRWLGRSPTVAIALLDRHLDAPDIADRLPLHLEVDPVGVDECVLCWRAALDASRAGSGLEREERAAAARRLGLRNRVGIGLAARASDLALPGAADADGVVADVECRLRELVQPSATRGIIVEKPETTLSSVVGSDATKKALERFLFLCEEAPLVEGAGRSGATALFAGPSGTGKTMAARALARELERPLYRVDLASLTSKWIGETEKNLRDAMIAAELAGAVLLFDEGDALFGKRGEVVKGTDRYANLEVSYLLQAIESYAGIAIVTTNLRKNIDEAFERRFDMILEFTPPGRRERAQIWKQELGPSGGTITDAVLEDVARRAELHGGNIASASRVAKVLARHRGDDRITEEDLRAALQGEYLKMGSTVQAANWAERPPLAARGRPS